MNQKAKKKAAAFGRRYRLGAAAGRDCISWKGIQELSWRYLFDNLLMFSGVPGSRRFPGFPEITQIHNFDHSWTFQIGNPKNPKVYDFAIFFDISN